MSRKKLPTEELKVKVSVTIDREVNNEIELFINNKSRYIEELIIKDIKKRNHGK